MDWSGSFAGHTKGRHSDPSTPGFQFIWDPALIHLSNAGNSQVADLITKCRHDGCPALLFVLNPTEATSSLLSPLADIVLSLLWHPRALLAPPGSPPARFSSLAFFAISSFSRSTSGAPPTPPTPITIHPLWDWAMPSSPYKIAFHKIAPFLSHFPDDSAFCQLRDSLSFGAIINYTGPRHQPHLCQPSPRYSQHGTDEIRTKDFAKGFRTKDFPYDPLEQAQSLPLFNLRLAKIYTTLKKISLKPRAINDHSAGGADATNFHSERFMQDRWISWDNSCEALTACGRFTLGFEFDLVAAYKLLWLALQDLHLHGEAVPATSGTPGVLGRTAFSLRLNFGGNTSYDAFQPLGYVLEHICRSVTNAICPNAIIFRFCDNAKILIPASASHPGRPDWRTAGKAFEACAEAFRAAGIPVHPERPATRWVWHGHQQDSINMSGILTTERRNFLIATGKEWLAKERITLRQAQSVHGLFQHASQVTPAGKKFLLRMRRFLRVLFQREAELPGRSSHISAGWKDDLRWWVPLLESPRYSGIYLLRDREWSDAVSLNLVLGAPTDASLIGEGFALGNRHSSRPWSRATLEAAWREDSFSLPMLEGLAVANCLATHGHRLQRKKVLIRCDSKTFVDAFNAESTTDDHIAVIITAIHHISSIHNFTVRLSHIAGEDNIQADPLSRLRLAEYERCHPSSIRTDILPWPLHAPWPARRTPFTAEFFRQLGRIMTRQRDTGWRSAAATSSTLSKTLH
jgi:hypothetical protein